MARGCGEFIISWRLSDLLISAQVTRSADFLLLEKQRRQQMAAAGGGNSFGDPKYDVLPDTLCCTRRGKRKRLLPYFPAGKAPVGPLWGNGSWDPDPHGAGDRQPGAPFWGLGSLPCCIPWAPASPSTSLPDTYFTLPLTSCLRTVSPSCLLQEMNSLSPCNTFSVKWTFPPRKGLLQELQCLSSPSPAPCSQQGQVCHQSKARHEKCGLSPAAQGKVPQQHPGDKAASSSLDKCSFTLVSENGPAPRDSWQHPPSPHSGGFSPCDSTPPHWGPPHSTLGLACHLKDGVLTLGGWGGGGSLWVRNDLITPYPHPNCYSSISDVPRGYGTIQAGEDLRRLPAQPSPTWGQPHTWLLLLPARRCLTRASARQRFSLGSDEQDVLSPGICIAMGRCGISVGHPWAEVSACGV